MQVEQSQTQGIRVVVRIRPASSNAAQQSALLHHSDVADGLVIRDETTIEVASHSKSSFRFDSVFPTATAQSDIFKSVGKPAADKFLRGYNSTIFAYGQTGSGKTYTMSGSSEDRGLVPRVCEYLFSQLHKQRRMSVAATPMKRPNLTSSNAQEAKISVSYIEIYNETLRDLLSAPSDTESNHVLQLREDPKYGVYADGATEIPVDSLAQMADVLHMGNLQRTVSATRMNTCSSRSHAVLIMRMERTDPVDPTKRYFARLNLVDLAGSERQKKAETTGLQLKEASSINKSLSVLAHVIWALTDGKEKDGQKEKENGSQPAFVHYRDSKLTFLLRDSLGGNALTTLIACVAPETPSLAETVSTLRFASRAKNVRNKPHLNEETTLSARDVETLRAEVLSLRRQLAVQQTHPLGNCTSPDRRSRVVLGDLMNVAASGENEKNDNSSCANPEEQVVWERLQSYQEYAQALELRVQNLQLALKLKSQSSEFDNLVAKITNPAQNPDCIRLQMRIQELALLQTSKLESVVAALDRNLRTSPSEESAESAVPATAQSLESYLRQFDARMFSLQSELSRERAARELLEARLASMREIADCVDQGTQSGIDTADGSTQSVSWEVKDAASEADIVVAVETSDAATETMTTASSNAVDTSIQLESVPVQECATSPIPLPADCNKWTEQLPTMSEVELVRSQVMEDRLADLTVGMDRYKSMFETACADMTLLHAECARLREENGKMATMLGHQNPLQRIHVMQTLKKENNELNLRIKRLERLLADNDIVFAPCATAAVATGSSVVASVEAINACAV
jgi:hypothetical protein